MTTPKTELPEKMPLTSMDIAEEKREELKCCLKTAFPEVFGEDKIDYDQLKRVLGEWVEPDRERFGLNWPGKAACMKVIQAPSVGTLKPCPDESVDWDTTQNLFIEGDNLEVLKLLQKAYFGKVKMIYIDPPYNTGKEFIYPDKYAETLDTYLEYTGQKDAEGRRFSTNTDTSGRFHSRWLNMMYPRLYLAKNLLREDGAIFISIDDNEFGNLKSLCDHLFGEENHAATISVINNLKGRNDKKNIATCHEYLLVYGKQEFESYGVPLNKEQLAAYKYEDEAGHKYALRDLRKRGGADKRTDRPNLYFPIYYNESTNQCSLEKHSDTDVEIFPLLGDGTEGCWRWGKTKVLENLDILHPKYNRTKDRWGIEHRVYLDPTVRDDISNDDEIDDEERLYERTSKPKSFWWGAELSTDVAGREFKVLFNGLSTDYPKSPFFIEKTLHMATKPGDLIIDFFAGYSTTAQAVQNLNAMGEGNRHFIMVQLPEQCDPETKEFKAGFHNIAELSRERIRRSSQILNDKGHTNQADLGFRAYKLDSSCFKRWEGDIAGLSEEQLILKLKDHAHHISDNAKAEDILYELLLKDGFELTVPIQKLTLAGKEVFSIAKGELLICLEKQLTQELMDEIAALDPARVIVLDAGFQNNDQLKANAVQTFKARARDKETAIVFRTV